MNEQRLTSQDFLKQDAKLKRQSRWSKFRAVIFSLLFTVAYGYGIVRLFEGKQDALEMLSSSFIMLLPYALGAIGNFLLMWRKEDDLPVIEAITWPWVYCLALFMVVIVWSKGMLFCLVIGVPILFPAASLGGFTAWLLKQRPKVAMVFVMLTMMSPILASPVEAQFDKPYSTTTTHTWIDIDADAETVWNQITSVEPITDEEHRSRWVHWIGLPRPISAELSHDGVGGVRDATFANGLRFDEIVTVWQPNEYIEFEIDLTSEKLPAPINLLDGETFDIPMASYRLEPLPDGTLRLHLMSEHYLETRLNKYGTFWTNQIVQTSQNYILEVIKGRAEQK